MAVSIIATHIRSRNAQSLIADFEYDDGVQERCNIPNAPTFADDAEAIAYLAARIANREAGRVQSEIQNNLAEIVKDGPDATPIFNASTAQDNAAFVREHYAKATKEQAIAIGAYLDTLTDTQLRDAFGISQSAVTNTLRPKLTIATSKWNDIQSEVGG